MGAAAQFDLLAVLVDGGIDGEFVQVHCWCPFSCWVLEGAGPAPSKRRAGGLARDMGNRSEEHTSELQSLMRISYAVFCLKKNTELTRHNSSIRYNIKLTQEN